MLSKDFLIGAVIGGTAVAALGLIFRRSKSVERKCRRPRFARSGIDGGPRICLDGKRRVCVAASGSVAAVKIGEIVSRLVKHGLYVDLVLTRSAAHFQSVAYPSRVTGDTYGWDTIERLEQLCDDVGTPRLQVWRDDDEWAGYNSLSDPVVHIMLAKRNHVLAVVPLCANTLSTLVNGGANTLLSELVRAWYYSLEPSFVDLIAANFGRSALCKPFLVAPAMNTYMWYQQVTKEAVSVLMRRGVTIIEPTVKKLACGDTGKGALASVDDVVREITNALSRHMKSRQERPVCMP